MDEEKKKRVSWDEYFMNIAHLVATRSTCNRGVPIKYLSKYKGVGAVIVKDRVILSTGYNGSPRGLDHCDDVGHEMIEGHCVRTVHAEANALASAAKHGIAVDKATFYTTASPCYDCFKMLINAGIERIVCGSFYGSRYGASEKVVGLAAQAGIQFEFLRSESDQPHGFDEDTIRITEAKVADINKLKVRKIHPSATVPSYSHNGDAGLDLFAVEGATVASGKRASIGTGISVEIPMGYAGLIWDRSGLSQKKGLKTLGGVIDSTYRGEIIVGLYNTSDEAVELMKGDRVAQMLIQPVESAKLEIVEDLSETQRADKGFGSTERSEGKKLEESEIREIKQASVPEEIKTQNKNTRKEENGEGKTKSRW